MDLLTTIFLAGTGVVAGVIAAMVGGAAVVIYPALIATGVSPQLAAVCNLASIMPATMLAALADRSQLPPFDRAFVSLIVLVLALTVVQGWWRYVLLVPTIWTAAFVWETRLIEDSPTTRPLLLGVILIVLMAVRPQGLLGTPRVEVV